MRAMRVVCPYTPAGLRDETRAALAGLGRPVDMVDVSGADTAYADLVEGLWAAGADFLLVEHDMIPTVEAVERMERCGQWWCACPYAVNHQAGEEIIGFGFTRFRAQLLTAEPDAALAAGRWQGQWPPRHWACIDSRLARVLTARVDPSTGHGWLPHRHRPGVGHLHLV
jgi:hypothetical protein